MEGLLLILDFSYYVLVWRQTDIKKRKTTTRNSEAELVDLFIVDNCFFFSIINYIPNIEFFKIVIINYIHNIEVNLALAILHVVVHNLLTQNQNRLKFWI